MYAAHSGHLMIVQALLNSGADETAKDENGLTALKQATRHNRAPVVQLLKEIATCLITHSPPT